VSVGVIVADRAGAASPHPAQPVPPPPAVCPPGIRGREPVCDRLAMRLHRAATERGSRRSHDRRACTPARCGG